MIRVYNDFVSACILASIVTVLVFVSLPRPPKGEKDNSVAILWKTFILSMIVCYTVLYFLNDTPSSTQVMGHMLHGEPDF